MNRLLVPILFLFLVTILMGVRCQRDFTVEAKQGFAEKFNVTPAQKSYSVNDTIWLDFQTTSKTLFDTISNQRLSSSAVKFIFELSLLAKYNYPVVPSNVFCDFIFPNNISSNIGTSPNSTGTWFEVGCDNAASYNIKIGVVPKYQGYYVLDMSRSCLIQACAGQANPYPSSWLRFTYNVNDTNKDVYLSIPASARNDGGYTERILDEKVAYAFRVQ